MESDLTPLGEEMPEPEQLSNDNPENEEQSQINQHRTLTTSKFPKITDDKFYSKITKMFKKFEISRKRVSMKEYCFPKKFTLQKPQQFVAEYLSPNTDYRGLLLFHQIGSGKTCSAVNIAQQWVGKKRILVVVPASLITNFKKELKSQCAGDMYLTHKEREQLHKLKHDSKEYKQIMERADHRIHKYYNIMSYHKFVALVEKRQLNLKNTLLIIDEVQNMISEDGKFYNTLYKTIKNAPNDLRLVLLTATPMFDDILELPLMLNLLPLPKPFDVKGFYKKFVHVTKNKNGNYTYKAKNMKVLKEMIKGFVSFYRGAPPSVFPEKRLKIVKAEMSKFQYDIYRKITEQEIKVRPNSTDILNLPNSFFIGSRMTSNIVFPNGKMAHEGYNSLTKSTVGGDKLARYSSKFYHIMKKVTSVKSPVFIYSNFKEYGGLKSLVRILEINGYKNLLTHGQGKKRYAYWTGDLTIEKKEKIRMIYNQSSNKDGSKLKILLGSPAAKEGVSLFNTRAMFVIDPYWNMSRMLQIFGRAVRFCSHKELPPEQRYVKIYLYLATHKNHESIDKYILGLAKEKHALISQFEKALKESAVDCQLNYYANVYPGEEKLICAK
jgi:superfamily II DNA or RNA helicase